MPQETHTMDIFFADNVATPCNIIAALFVLAFFTSSYRLFTQ